MNRTGIILLVEDDKNIQRINRRILEREGFQVLCAGTLSEARELLQTHTPDVLVLDIMLPDGSGLSFCEKIRPTTSAPVLFLTALDEKSEIIEGLVAGGNDYITKPFGIMEFLSRVRAALRRSAPEEKQNVYAFHEILLDNARHSVTVNGTHVDLTYKEYSLLRLLLENTNLVVTREIILQVVWGTDISVESRTVDMHIRTLRKKLGDAGRYICTVRKVGYKLADSEEGEEE